MTQKHSNEFGTMHYAAQGKPQLNACNIYICPVCVSWEHAKYNEGCAEYKAFYPLW